MDQASRETALKILGGPLTPERVGNIIAAGKADLVEKLEEFQGVNTSQEGNWLYCPDCCEAFGPGAPPKHAADCELAAVLARHEAKL